VYLLDYDEHKGEDTIRCLSLDDGRKIRRNGYPVLTKPNHGITRTVPAISGNFVVTMGPQCHLACWDLRSGACRWLIDLAGKYDAAVPPWYSGQCPLIDNGAVIAAPCGNALMLAVDSETGEVLWESPNPRAWTMTHGSLVPMEVAGKRTYVYAASGGVVGVDADDGSILWEYGDWAVDFANCPSPVVLPGERLLLTAGYGRDVGSLILQVKSTSWGVLAERSLALTPDQFNSEIHTPVFHEGHLYGVHKRGRGRMVCLDESGTELWNSGQDRFGNGPYLVADGLLILLSEDGMLTLTDASPSGYRRLARHQVLPAATDAWAPPALAGGRLVVRDFTRLMCIALLDCEDTHCISTPAATRNGAVPSIVE
jgi:outer membrane protein assembly factor BamB